jgi:hypothetical protein
MSILYFIQGKHQKVNEKEQGIKQKLISAKIGPSCLDEVVISMKKKDCVFGLGGGCRLD